MQERTVTSEIEICGKDVFGLFAGLRGVRDMLPIPQYRARWVAFRRRQSV